MCLTDVSYFFLCEHCNKVGCLRISFHYTQGYWAYSQFSWVKIKQQTCLSSMPVEACLLEGYERCFSLLPPSSTKRDSLVPCCQQLGTLRVLQKRTGHSVRPSPPTKFQRYVSITTKVKFFLDIISGPNPWKKKYGGGMAPPILKFGIVGCEWSASFSKLFYHLYASRIKLGGSYNPPEDFRNKINIFLLPGIETRIRRRPAP